MNFLVRMYDANYRSYLNIIADLDQNRMQFSLNLNGNHLHIIQISAKISMRLSLTIKLNKSIDTSQYLIRKWKCSLVAGYSAPSLNETTSFRPI